MVAPRRWSWRPSGRALTAHRKGTWLRHPRQRSESSLHRLQRRVPHRELMTVICRLKNCAPANASSNKLANSKPVRQRPPWLRTNAGRPRPQRLRALPNPIRCPRHLRSPRSLSWLTLRRWWCRKPRPSKPSSLLRRSLRLRVRLQRHHHHRRAVRPAPTSLRGNAGMTAHRPPPTDRPRVIEPSGPRVDLKTQALANGRRAPIKALPHGPPLTDPPQIADLVQAVIVRRPTARPVLPPPAANPFAILP